MPGLRNNLVMYNSFLYKLERRNLNRNMYCCTKKEKLKCKARLVTTSDCDTIILKNMLHNHGPTFNGDYSAAQPRYVSIDKTVMTKTEFGVRNQRLKKKLKLERRKDPEMEIIVLETT